MDYPYLPIGRDYGLNMKIPFFSIIIPTYNRAQFLKIAIESVLAQTFIDYELIIVDDGSTDETKELISLCAMRYAQCAIRYIYQKHLGVTLARNRGVKEAKGRFICFLDSDDRFRSNKLQTTYDYIKNYPKCKIFHTEELWYRNGSILAQKKHHKKPSGYVFENAVKICCISISTVAIHHSIFKEVGLFDKKLPACEDYDFWVRVTARYPVMLIPQYLTIKEGGLADQQSKKFPAMDKFRIYALQKILESRTLTKDNYRIAYNECKRKCRIYLIGAEKRGRISEVNRCRKMLKTLEKRLHHTNF